MHRRGILYAPDYVINAGGVIAATAELDPGGYDPDRVRARLAVIDRRLEAILVEAAARDVPPLVVAEAVAARLRAERIAAATGRRAPVPGRSPAAAAAASLEPRVQRARSR